MIIQLEQNVEQFPLLTPEMVLDCSGKTVVLDTETTGLSWYSDKFIGVGLYCPEANVAGYIPTHSDRMRGKIKDLLLQWSRGTTVIGHNLKFDLNFIGIIPDEVGWKPIDTTVMVHLYDSRLRKNMASAEQVFLGTSSKRQHVSGAPERTPIWKWPEDVRAKYCINDCIVAYQLAQTLMPLLAELGVEKVFRKDMKYMSVLMRAERRGILIDDEYMIKAAEKQLLTVEDLEQRLYDATGRTFNWRSHKQLSEAIYAGMGIAKPKNPFADSDGIDRSRFADAGLYKSVCTATFLLTEKTKHPLGTLIAALRESYRMYTTLNKYRQLADDNRVVHTSYNYTGTRTGRLSSSKPNMQNVPSEARGRFTQSIYTGDAHRTEEYNLRSGFIARPGMMFLSVDYKQMEMRMFGILSADPFMLKSLTEGRDIHADIAEKVWGTRDKVHREWSKTISFGLIYGMTIGSLMFKLNMNKMQAARVCDQYWAEFPRIQPWLNDVVEECIANGYIRYWSGRIWREDNRIDMYKGANAQIQGGCADLLSVAALRADKWCREQSSEHAIVNFVHDELIIEVPEDDVERSSREVSEIMRVEDLLGIPFITDSKAGRSYGSEEDLFGKESYEIIPKDEPIEEYLGVGAGEADE